MRFMCHLKTLWNKPLDVAANRIPFRAAKHSLRSSVKNNNSLFDIDGDDRVHRRGDYVRYALFAFTQLLLNPFAFGDIHLHACRMQKLSLCIHHRSRIEKHGSLLSLLGKDDHLFIAKLSSLLPLLKEIP
jgi:hypothetical protein